MAWTKPGPGRRRTLATEERLRSDITRAIYRYLCRVPDDVFPDTREIGADFFKVVIHKEGVEWFASRLGLEEMDYDRIRSALAGMRVDDKRMERVERAVDSMEGLGVLIKVGGGWELCERANAREAERACAAQEQALAEQESEREARQGPDMEAAREWLDHNWSTITERNEDILTYCRDRRATFRAALRDGRDIGGRDLKAIQRGLMLLGGPDNAVLLCDLIKWSADDNDIVVAQQAMRAEAEREKEAAETQARQAQREKQAERDREREEDNARRDEENSLKEKAERRQRAKESDAAHLRVLEDELEGEIPERMAEAQKYVAKRDATIAKLEARLEKLKKQGRRTAQAEDNLDKAREAAEAYETENFLPEDWAAEAERVKGMIAKARAEVRGWEAADAALAAGKTVEEQRAAFAAARAEALQAAGV